MTRRTWEIARRYFAWPFVAGVALLAVGGRLHRLVSRAGLVCLAAAGLVLVFFRDPERETPDLPGHVYAAADGVVRDVGEVGEEEMPSGDALRISTFLSLHNVHVNRAPVKGWVSNVERIPGGYAPALFGSSEGNHRVRVRIEGDAGPALVVQKAGLIARRISTWVSGGDVLGAGERIGVIHFGSRADVLLPAGLFEPLVRPGDRVRAGVTPVARRAQEPGGDHRPD